MSDKRVSPYVGRFAPSPSGSLHFGSLVAALGSYLRARSLAGKWLLRIEDIDPPREVEGAADDIRRTLELFGFEWDDRVLYQSQRFDAYDATINAFLADQQAYYCHCSRKQIQQEMHGIYDGRCRHAHHSDGAVRLYNQHAVAEFNDLLLGKIQVPTEFASEDYIIQRSDGLFAYQLAVVLDDAHQGVTEIVRGADLLDASCRQLTLYRQLGLAEPNFIHLPLASTEPGFKLSKQNHATALNKKQPQAELAAALAFLGQAPVDTDSPQQMLAQAINQFQLSAIPAKTEILIGH
ncbi:tRNA glutamyl-Q(34) synthetase GluQRS [Shewanella avicenniae]|uniref:Glutamyl-Q tRNA(Asp) synthetase n=1 Tax=Shewanella avicenniae TaxID=2814294 RepID=A0ABX7QP89_9GAMM|nr:tRNA glutamyl-Q(34) synthetase GluQRS [Shewanella avicenniae]QSX33079.1 tRNA glutamyl-Q(34) synthetase GluQRS [Shewanella avicenniae]